ncbi:MAG: hypothetical protein NWE91_02770 [Candidatus Bathyarchaeota archaeon]|nr:hypothetical protein [Candidatus Bathyarchaeota archaeon]
MSKNNERKPKTNSEVLGRFLSGIQNLARESLDELAELEVNKPIAALKDKDTHTYDALFWEPKEGQRGKFEQTSKSANNNSTLWQDLKAWLEKNNGKAQLGEHFIWQFSTDQNVVGRKKTK